MDGELHVGVRQPWHRLLVEIGEQIALLQLADQHFDLDERRDRAHVTGREPFTDPVNQLLNPPVGDDSFVTGNVTVRVFRYRGLGDTERVGDLPLCEPPFAEVLSQHRADRRQKLVDDDPLDEVHYSVSPENSESAPIRDACGPSWS